MLNHRLQAGTPAGVRICRVWFPVVSLVPSSTTGWELSSLRDEEAGVGREGASTERRVSGACLFGGGLVGALRAQREL